jgi:hypothetical protein
MRGRTYACLLILMLWSSVTALQAQFCPSRDGKSPDAAAASVLHGTIVLHPGLRPWLGFVTASPVCGQNEIELALGKADAWTQAKRMNHCGAAVKGVIGESATAYYSADLDIFDPQITPDASCQLLPAEPDETKQPISTKLRTYQATVFIDIRHNKPLRGEVSSNGYLLQPWRAYVSTSLNGEKDLDLSCRDGFKLVSFKGTGSHAELFNTKTARLDSNEQGPASLAIVCRRSN